VVIRLSDFPLFNVQISGLPLYADSSIVGFPIPICPFPSADLGPCQRNHPGRDDLAALPGSDLTSFWEYLYRSKSAPSSPVVTKFTLMPTPSEDAY
jgi:hypothetical protein